MCTLLCILHVTCGVCCVDGCDGRGRARWVGSIAKISADRLLIVMRYVNVVNALLLGVSCFFAFTLITDITSFFLATYIGCVV